MGVLDVSHDSFGRLCLVDYISADEVVRLVGWEYLGREWVGEAAGFTEWLRLASEPDVVRSIALDLQALPVSVAEVVLLVLRLPLRRGMSTDLEK